ncbi:MAG: rhomboid family intramembrane serine protease [Planctomycetes bacterium]|nr:rhomboid family intramembrane serine protease [Planctomycetota bacterium]
MNMYDRDYAREDESSFAGGPWSMVSKLVAINVVVYLVQVLFFQNNPDRIIDLFAMHANLPTHPWQFYQLLTAGFLHDPNNIWHIIGNMAVLWFLGRDVEAIYGQKAFLQFYLSTIVLAGVAWLIYEQAVGSPKAVALGASGGVTGVLVLFAMHYPRRMVYLYFLIPIPIWVLATLVIGWDAISALWQPAGDKVGHSAHLGGAACGFLFYYTRWQLGALWPGQWVKSWRKPKFRIHQPDEPAEQTDDAELKAEVDRILEKISNQGESSLTTRERRTLEDASRRYQKRGRR